MRDKGERWLGRRWKGVALKDFGSGLACRPGGERAKLVEARNIVLKEARQVALPGAFHDGFVRLRSQPIAERPTQSIGDERAFDAKETFAQAKKPSPRRDALSNPISGARVASQEKRERLPTLARLDVIGPGRNGPDHRLDRLFVSRDFSRFIRLLRQDEEKRRGDAPCAKEALTGDFNETCRRAGLTERAK